MVLFSDNGRNKQGRALENIPDSRAFSNLEKEFEKVGES